MTRRPDLVDVWPFRLNDAGHPEVLMLRRAPSRILPGLWQGVSGLIEPGERVVDAARRELDEETGFRGRSIEAFYHLDYVAEFLWEPADALMSSAHFAARVTPPAEPVLSHEHDAFLWLTLDEAIALAVWPGYREALRRVRDNLVDPERAIWFTVAAGAGGG